MKHLIFCSKEQPNKNFVPDRPTLAFCEEVFKSKLVEPLGLRVIQVVFTGEGVFNSDPTFSWGSLRAAGKNWALGFSLPPS
jgi:hypothetical protein